MLSPGPSPKSFGATLDSIKFQTHGTRSPTTLEGIPKRPRFEDNSISQFSLCPEDLSIDLSLSSTDSFPPTSPESGVDLQYSPSNNAFFRTSMEGILSHITDNLSRPPHIQILEEPEQVSPEHVAFERNCSFFQRTILLRAFSCSLCIRIIAQDTIAKDTELL